jgi:hypothetical protein
MSNQHQTTDIYKYIFIAFAALFIVAAVVFVGMRGYIPYGIAFVSGGESFNSTLLVVRPATMEPVLGTVVGRYSEVTYAVQPYVLTDTRRTNGALQYIVQPIGNEEHTTATLFAREFGHQVLVSIPFFGGLVRALAHPVGLMGLLGVPMLMFLLHGLQRVRVSHVFRRARMLSTESLERGAFDGVVPAMQQPTKEGEHMERKGLWGTAMRLFTRNDTNEVQEERAKNVNNDGMTVELKKWGEGRVTDILATTPRSHRYGM